MSFGAFPGQPPFEPPHHHPEPPHHKAAAHHAAPAPPSAPRFHHGEPSEQRATSGADHPSLFDDQPGSAPAADRQARNVDSQARNDQLANAAVLGVVGTGIALRAVLKVIVPIVILIIFIVIAINVIHTANSVNSAFNDQNGVINPSYESITLPNGSVTTITAANP